jgi:hypothetical protein
VAFDWASDGCSAVAIRISDDVVRRTQPSEFSRAGGTAKGPRWRRRASAEKSSGLTSEQKKTNFEAGRASAALYVLVRIKAKTTMIAVAARQSPMRRSSRLVKSRSVISPSFRLERRMVPRAYDTIGSRGRNPTAQEYATWGTVRTWFESVCFPGHLSLFPADPEILSCVTKGGGMGTARAGWLALATSVRATSACSDG